MSILAEKTHFDEEKGRIVKETIFDPSDVLDANAADRASRAQFGKYKGNLVHAARIDMGNVRRLKAMGYDLLSSDPDEVRRALVYLQSNEKQLLTVDGNPFALHRNTWA